MKNNKYLPIIVLIIVALIFWSLGAHKYFSFQSLKNNYVFLENYVNNNLALSILIYSLIYITIISLSLPVATFMTIAGGLLFGQIMGTFITVLSASIGASILFLSVKHVAPETIEGKLGKFVKKMKSGFQQDAFFYLLSLRLMPIFPFVIINLAAAFFKTRLEIFFTATFIGIVPGSFVYTSIGVAMKEVINTPSFSAAIVLDPKIIFALAGLGALSLIPVIYKKFKKIR